MTRFSLTNTLWSVKIGNHHIPVQPIQHWSHKQRRQNTATALAKAWTAKRGRNGRWLLETVLRKQSHTCWISLDYHATIHHNRRLRTSLGSAVKKQKCTKNIGLGIIFVYWITSQAKSHASQPALRQCVQNQIGENQPCFVTMIFTTERGIAQRLYRAGHDPSTPSTPRNIKPRRSLCDVVYTSSKSSWSLGSVQYGALVLSYIGNGTLAC